MLPTNADADALSSASLKVEASSDSIVECELEGEDDWVVVKKQRITILVPPPSPRPLQHVSCEETEPRIVKQSTGAQKKRSPELKNDEQKEPHAPAPSNKSLADDKLLCLRAQEVGYNLVASPKFEQPSTIKTSSNRKMIALYRKPVNVLRLLPFGSLHAVNKRVRAQNLGRKLKERGGLRSWLISQGLDRFVNVFERENVTEYQLANLSMRMLKDMGTDAVGPRRKLIYAIDCLCQPYYSQPYYF